MPAARRISRKILFNGPISQGVTRNEVINEPLRPKSSRIGMQMDTMNENVLSSQTSLFEYADDSTYKSDRRVFPEAVSVKPYTKSK